MFNLAILPFAILLPSLQKSFCLNTNPQHNKQVLQKYFFIWYLFHLQIKSVVLSTCTYLWTFLNKHQPYWSNLAVLFIKESMITIVCNAKLLYYYYLSPISISFFDILCVFICIIIIISWDIVCINLWETCKWVTLSTILCRICSVAK